MRPIKKSYFTLLEVLVSMGVFSLLMLALMQFFSAAQGVWERTGNKAELFDSARTAMDILANDLACAYYERDHDANYQFFSISSSDTTQVVFAAKKEEGNTQLFYKWDSSSWKLHRVEKKESDVFSAGTVTPTVNWFTRSGKTAWITDMSGTALTNGSGETPYCLAENVLDYSIKAYKKSDLASPISVSSSVNDKFPDVIIVTMTMLSNDAHEKLLNRLTNDAGIKDFFEGKTDGSTFKYLQPNGTESSEKKSIQYILNAGGTLTEGDDTTQMILFNGCQRFSRVIPLDCGQND